MVSLRVHNLNKPSFIKYFSYISLKLLYFNRQLLTIPSASKNSIPIDGPKLFNPSTASAFKNSIEIV